MEEDGIKYMKNGLSQKKSTGFIQSGKMEKESDLVQTNFSPVELKKSQVSKTVPTSEESLNSQKEVEECQLLLSEKILAIQIILGDFKAIKKSFPESWMTTKDGKIYWCLKDSFHKFDIKEGCLSVDDMGADLLIDKILEKSTSTGDNE